MCLSTKQATGWLTRYQWLIRMLKRRWYDSRQLAWRKQGESTHSTLVLTGRNGFEKGLAGLGATWRSLLRLFWWRLRHQSTALLLHDHTQKPILPLHAAHLLLHYTPHIFCCMTTHRNQFYHYMLHIFCCITCLITCCTSSAAWPHTQTQLYDYMLLILCCKLQTSTTHCSSCAVNYKHPLHTTDLVL